MTINKMSDLFMHAEPAYLADITKVEPYFGLSRKGYLQALANRWGDFKVWWNFKSADNGDVFIHKTVFEISESPFLKQSWMFSQVNNRGLLPCEIVFDVDKDNETHRLIVEGMLLQLGATFAEFKSRNGVHFHVIDTSYNVYTCKRSLSLPALRQLLSIFKCDAMLANPTHTISLEWSMHWKDPTHKLTLIAMTTDFQREWLGVD